MKRTPLLLLALTLAGCGGTTALVAPSTAPLTQTFGPLVTRVVGAAQTPVTASAANGANVTGLAGALVTDLTLNNQTPPNLDDTRIFYAATKAGNTDIYSSRPDGTDTQRLTSSAAWETQPAVSPDGTKIVYVQFAFPKPTIWVMNADGSGKTQLTPDTDECFFPAWSPDGTQIVYRKKRTTSYDYWMMNPDGTNQHLFTYSNSPFPSAIDWSKDGKTLVTTEWDNGYLQVALFGLNGSYLLLTSTTGNKYSPHFSPDGQQIVYQNEVAGKPTTYQMNVDGTGNIPVSTSNTVEYTPCYSPDGNRVLVIRFDGLHNAMGYYEVATSRFTPLNISDCELPNWSGFSKRTPQKLIGTGATLGASAAGFLFGQRGKTVGSLLAFDTPAATRANARIATQSAPYNDYGTNLIFSITTSAGLTSLSFVNLNGAGVPSATITPSLPPTTTNALVSYDATDGTVTSVIPYAANRSVQPERVGRVTVLRGSFPAVFNGKGENVAPSGARAVRIDTTTGALLGVE